jgi:small redox-active disulfide protein 2
MFTSKLKTQATMEIKILGSECQKCNTLEKRTREVVEKNNIDATITKVEDFIEIMKLGVMTTPALVVDGQVLVKGRVPSIAEISELLIEMSQKKGN